MSTKWCGNESIYFITNFLHAKAYFLCQFGKVITLINNDGIDWKVKLDSDRKKSLQLTDSKSIILSSVVDSNI